MSTGALAHALARVTSGMSESISHSCSLGDFFKLPVAEPFSLRAYKMFFLTLAYVNESSSSLRLPPCLLYKVSWPNKWKRKSYSTQNASTKSKSIIRQCIFSMSVFIDEVEVRRLCFK